MILRELFYIDNEIKSMSNDMRQTPSRDFSTLKQKDTRKTRLTLRQINELRKSSELHILEQEKELDFISTMYKPPEQPAMTG
jgi:hypothetical protein